MNEKVSVVVPAYNEGKRIGKVLSALVKAKKKELVAEIIVVDDGSSDETARVASGFPVSLIKFTENRGKGAALAAGIRESKTDIVLFLDADLVGLKCEHIETLTKPIVDNPVIGMTIGLFRGSGFVADFGNGIAAISGQRAVRVSWMKEIIGLDSSRYGADYLITHYARKNKVKTVRVYLDHLTHVYKETKHGFILGFFKYRLKMFCEIFKTIFSNRLKIKYKGSYVPSDTNEAYED